VGPKNLDPTCRPGWAEIGKVLALPDMKQPEHLGFDPIGKHGEQFWRLHPHRDGGNHEKIIKDAKIKVD
jgi:hypothetical protein